MIDDEEFRKSLREDSALVESAEGHFRPEGWTWLMSQVPNTAFTPSQRLIANQMHDAGEAMIELFGQLAEMSAAFDGESDQRLLRRYVAVTKAFFAAWYETTERSMGYLAAFGQTFGGDQPPFRSVTKFIKWCEREPHIPSWATTVLDDARRYRTLVTHAAELPGHDWSTFSTGAGTVGVRLFGSGATPDNATDNDWAGQPGDWHAISTDPYLAGIAICRVLYATLPRVSGWVLRDDPGLGPNALSEEP